MLNIEDSIILMIDVQEKLVKVANSGNETANNAEKIINAGNILNIPKIVTEQYPKGLGNTIENISNLVSITDIYEKTYFSALKHEIIKLRLRTFQKKQVIIFGIETHICVLQTVEDLLNIGYEVYVITDASSSRSPENHKIGLNYMQQLGARLVTTEIALFQLLKGSKHEKFKEVQALIK